MRPPLVIGLGNTLMGDDGVGCRVIECLRERGLSVPDVELVVGGADLFSLAEVLRGRTRIVLVDAVPGDDPPGTVIFGVHEAASPPEIEPVHAHHLCPLWTLKILANALPGLGAARVELVGITVRDVRVGDGLSPELDAMLPKIVARVRAHLGELGRGPEPAIPTDPA